MAECALLMVILEPIHDYFECVGAHSAVNSKTQYFSVYHSYQFMSEAGSGPTTRAVLSDLKQILIIKHI